MQFYIMQILGVGFALTILFSAQVAMAGQCYQPKEAEAEQGIRIHSELMVIGLNCQHMVKAGEENLYVAYRKFTGEYEELFATYETILLNHFKGSGAGNPEERLHDMRTKFANKISNDAATMRPDVFCTRYGPRISQAIEMKYDDLRRWAGTIYPSHPVSKPLCES